MVDRDFDKYIAEIYQDMEIQIIQSMKRNLARHTLEEEEYGFNYPQWQAMKIKELRRYQRENGRILQGVSNKIPKDVSKHIKEELTQGSLDEMKKYREAMADGYKSAVAMKDSFFKINERKVNSLIKAVKNDLKTANTAALRMTNDVYREVIFKAGMFSANGVMTSKQAIDMATKDFLTRGINCIEYKDGRRVNIADYTSMAVRTANQRAYMIGEGEFRKRLGETLVIISQHNTSCEKCKPFERKVLIDDVYSGGTAEDGDYMLLSQAMAAGLFHPRCRHGLGTYYPELEDINGYETTDNRLNEYGDEELNRAHIENMVQRYRRLTFGSLDPYNIAKYQERLNKWEVRKSESDGHFEKMADITSNDWSETQPRVLDKETKKEIIEYAKSKNVNIVDLSEFDGDPELLKEIVDTLSKWEEILPTKKGITLRPSALATDDFGMARGRTIYIQNLALRDRKITLKNINSNKMYFASSDVCDIAAHEYGHVFSKEKGINAIEISKEAYYNIYKQYPSTKKILDYYKEISTYSFEVGKNELISEILAKHNSDPTAFTEEIIKLLKKKVTP